MSQTSNPVKAKEERIDIIMLASHMEYALGAHGNMPQISSPLRLSPDRYGFW
jgi:hypothetical protein